MSAPHTDWMKKGNATYKIVFDGSSSDRLMVLGKQSDKLQRY